MRTLTSHIVNPANDKLTITVQDEPGSGGANHSYLIAGFDTSTNPSNQEEQGYHGQFVLFQNGPIAEKGVNGVTHEALLAILEDRLTGFQSGPYACDDNAFALHHIRIAQAILQKRTKERMARGVEGTHKV